jgi:hypothetical protein
MVPPSQQPDDSSSMNRIEAGAAIEGGHITSSPYAVFEREKQRARRKRSTIAGEA